MSRKLNYIILDRNNRGTSKVTPKSLHFIDKQFILRARLFPFTFFQNLLEKIAYTETLNYIVVDRKTIAFIPFLSLEFDAKIIFRYRFVI